MPSSWSKSNHSSRETVCWSGFFRETEPIGYFYLYLCLYPHIYLQLYLSIYLPTYLLKLIYYKELAYMIMATEVSRPKRASGVSSSPNLRSKAGDAQCSSSKTGREQLFFIQPVVLFRPSTDWVRRTHTGEADLCYSVHPFKC